MLKMDRARSDWAPGGGDQVSNNPLPSPNPTRRMHILIVTNYFAPEAGAAAVRLTRLAKKLHRRGHQITVRLGEHP